MSLLKKSPQDFKSHSLPRGGRRLNRVPLLVILVLVSIFFILLSYGYLSKEKKEKVTTTIKHKTPQSVDEQSLFADNIPQNGTILTNKNLVSSKNQQQTSSKDNYIFNQNKDNKSDPATQQISSSTKTAKDSFLSEISAEKTKMLQAALIASSSVSGGKINSENMSTNEFTSTQKNNYTHSSTKQDDRDPWSKLSDPSENYLSSSRTPSLSSYEIKAGTVIPAIMITGINSELPGTIIAQVSQNVYDSATGEFLLIPQGARLVGLYNNSIMVGQERVLVAWNRLIYPDGSSINLDMMPGADQSGYSGFKDKVNNHYLKTFGSALMLSLFSAGIQLSQPQNDDEDDESSSEIIAASIGQQMGELGMEVARQGLSLAPTIEIRPGYQFVVMINKDMILSPWPYKNTLS